MTTIAVNNIDQGSDLLCSLGSSLSNIFTAAKGGYVLVLFVCLFVCLSVRLSGDICQQDYLQSHERICMQLLTEVCLGPKKNQ